MREDPFFLEGPAVISFSGGRTSGYMLRRVLDAHGGTLPPNIRVLFCNTGKERPETLDFVERCSAEWGVPVTWLEYRAVPDGTFVCNRGVRKGQTRPKWKHLSVEVNYATASRAGEPFDQLIVAKSAIPNVKMRWCTGQLKVLTTWRHVRGVLGWGEYRAAIGLRYDEPNRVARLAQRLKAREDRGKATYEETLFGRERVKKPKTEPLPAGEWPVCPLFDAKVTGQTVMDFWAASPFDLQLQPHEGNCDLCFLKGVDKIQKILRDRPDLAKWWVDHEDEGRGVKEEGSYFRNPRDRPSYRKMLALAEAGEALHLPDGTDITCECRCTD